ncbi:MAG: metal ABC transporter permease [Acidobacteriota bacterium]
MSASALVIVAVGSLVAASCALVGSFLVLRKMALLGDAISHAVLPGIVIAFLISGGRSTVSMMIGATALGVLTVFLVELSYRTRRLKEDASIGVVFPALFALGVLLISRYASAVDLDLDCVLYGEIAYAPLDVLTWGDLSLGPRALWLTGFVFLLNLSLVTLFYKELKITTFDTQLAATLGFAPTLVHYLLMSLVSVTVVGSFESVGAILVVAMLVVPPSAAYLLTQRLSTLLFLAVGLGVASALFGYLLARTLDASIAGGMAVMSGLIFLACFCFAPRHGLLARWLRHRRLGRRLAEQLLMLHLPKAGELGWELLDQRFRWAPGRLRAIARRLQERGWVEPGEAGLRLTAEGVRRLEAAGQQPLRHPLGEAPLGDSTAGAGPAPASP